MWGVQGLAWAGLIGWSAVVAVSGISLQALTQTVDTMATERAARVDRNTWSSDLAIVQLAMTDAGARLALSSLVDKIRYSGSDIAGVHLDINDQISSEIDHLKTMASAASVIEATNRIVALLNAREIELKAKRTGA
jgi:hypothetical protein